MKNNPSKIALAASLWLGILCSFGFQTVFAQELFVGYLVADNKGYINSYYDSEVSSGLESNNDGSGKTTAEMKMQGTYENWNFESIWEINPAKNEGYPILREQYTVEFDANGGTLAAASGTTEGWRLASMPTPTRAGYTFNGWFTEEAGGTQVTTSTVFSENTTIYARWTLVTYTITYTLDGGTVETANPASYTIKTEDFTLNNPTKAGYIFTGWTGTNGTTPQTTVTVEQGSTGNRSYTANFRTKGIPLATNLNFTIPTSHIYNGEAQGIGSVTAKTAGIGTITAVLYNGSTNFPTNAGTYSVTVDLAESEDFIAASGVVLGNYVIAKRPLTITGISASNKEYDGNDTTTVTGTAAVSVEIGSDVVTVVNGTASYADKNVGTGKTVTFSGFSLDGTGASNYVLSAQPASVAADITARQITVSVTSMYAKDKEYDGTSIAEIHGEATISGEISGDSVTLKGNALFDNKNVGDNKAITISGFSLDGKDAGNYTISSTLNLPSPGVITANITAKPITVTGVTAASRNYDGTTTVALSGGTLSGKVGNDNVGFELGSGTVADPNAGSDKPVTTNIILTGTDASNYTLTQPTGITVTITSSTPPPPQYTQATCTAAGLYWYNNTCNNITQAEAKEAKCYEDGKYWYNNTCNNKEQTPQQLCVADKGVWYNDNCYATQAEVNEAKCYEKDGYYWEDNKCKKDPTPPTPVQPATLTSSKLIVKTTANAILLSNLPQGVKVEVYNLQGKQIYSAYPENPKILKIGVQTKGMYIVKTGSQFVQAVVR